MMTLKEMIGEALASMCVVALPIALLFLGSAMGLK